MLATLYERYTFLLTGKIPQNLPTEGRLVVHPTAKLHIIVSIDLFITVCYENKLDKLPA